MTIIRKEVDKVGEFYQKKLFINALDDGGYEDCIAALAFPAYTWPGYVWINWQIMSFAEKEPWTTSEFTMRGRHVNVPEGLTFADDMQDIMEAHAPRTSAAAAGGTTATATNVGITGQEVHELEGSERYTFLNRDVKFGLPNNAYPCNANKIRYTNFGSYKGNCKTSNMVDIAEPHMIFIGGLTEAPANTTNQSLSVYGDHTDFGDLYTSLVDLMTKVQSGDQSTSMIDSALLDFQGSGFTKDTSGEMDLSNAANGLPTDDSDLIIRMNVTCRLDVYEPASRRRVLAP